MTDDGVFCIAVAAVIIALIAGIAWYQVDQQHQFSHRMKVCIDQGSTWDDKSHKCITYSGG